MRCCLRYCPARPHFSQTNRTLSPGVIAKCERAGHVRSPGSLPNSGISALRILKRSGSMDGDAERNGSPCLSRWLGKHPSYRLPLHKPPPTPKILAWQRRPSRLRQVLDIWPLALDNNQNCACDAPGDRGVLRCAKPLQHSIPLRSDATSVPHPSQHF